MAHTPNIRSDYLGKFLDPENIKKFVKVAAHGLSKYTFESIAFRGVSGALLAPPLALEMGKILMVVRKPRHEEVNHTFFPVEGDNNTRRYVIVDDFISSGATVKEIVAKISIFQPEARCIGAVQGTGIINDGKFFVTDILNRVGGVVIERYAIHPEQALNRKRKK